MSEDPVPVKNKDACFSRDSTEWATPPAFFSRLEKTFGTFTLDPAATRENALCPAFYTVEDDGLASPWTVKDKPGRVFLNPPYGPGAALWVAKARKEVEEDRAEIVVILLPSRTDVAWFHETVLSCPFASVIFIRGRLSFVGAKSSAPFPSILVIFSKSAEASIGGSFPARG